MHRRAPPSGLYRAHRERYPSPPAGARGAADRRRRRAGGDPPASGAPAIPPPDGGRPVAVPGGRMPLPEEIRDGRLCHPPSGPGPRPGGKAAGRRGSDAEHRTAGDATAAANAKEGRRIDGGRAADAVGTSDDVTGMEVDVPVGRVWEGRFGGGVATNSSNGSGGDGGPSDAGQTFAYKRRASSSPPASSGSASSGSGSGAPAAAMEVEGGRRMESKRTRQRSPQNGSGGDLDYATPPPRSSPRPPRALDTEGMRHGSGEVTTLLTLPPSTRSDGAVATSGLLSLLTLLSDRLPTDADATPGRYEVRDVTVTCEPGRRSAREKLSRVIGEGSDGAEPWGHQPLHYTQDDKWSCGEFLFLLRLKGTETRTCLREHVSRKSALTNSTT